MNKFENCFENMEKARTETFSKDVDRVNKIFEELNTKQHNYKNIFFDERKNNDIQKTIFEEMSKEYNSKIKDYDCSEKNITNNEDINWCDTCEGTTLKDCLECVKGDKNPKYHISDSTNVKYSPLEEHFINTVKSSKTEDLEKVYGIIAEELFRRYSKNNNKTKCEDSNHTYSQTGDFISSCEKNCSICDKNDPCVKDCLTCSEHKSDNKIQGKIYYKKNEEKPMEIEVDLTLDELKEIKKEIENEINEAVSDIIKRFRPFRYFDF